jgi:hypothetical protein
MPEKTSLQFLNFFLQKCLKETEWCALSFLWKYFGTITLKVRNFYWVLSQTVRCRFTMLVAEWDDNQCSSSMEHHHHINSADEVIMLMLRSWLQKILSVYFICIYLAAVHQQQCYDNTHYNLATVHMVWHWKNSATVDENLGYEVINWNNSIAIHILLNNSVVSYSKCNELNTYC